MYDLVHVIWKDAYGVSPNWYDLSDAEHLEPVAHVCQSVGWKTKDNDEVIVVVPHLSLKNEDVGITENSGCGEMTIPKSAIVSMEELFIENLDKVSSLTI